MPDGKGKKRQVHQIIGTDGTPYTAAVTGSLQVVNGFSQPLEGNDVKYYVCGKDYFAELIVDIGAAKESVYIAGWQVNWDAQLAPGKRLYDVLLSAAKANPSLKVYVMPWNDSPPVQTFDDQTKNALESINTTLKREQVFVHLAASVAPTNTAFYSHHQKQVVIDRKIGYVGGIDLAYGRYDDTHFNLRADADGRKGLNRYNACVAPVGNVASGGTEVVDPDLMAGGWDENVGIPYLVKTNARIAREAIERGAYQVPYASSVAMDKPGFPLSTTSEGLDPLRQPRQPWNDVEVRITGPAVQELTRNFVSRWNRGTKRTSLRLAPASKPTQGKGGCIVQVLRSAPGEMCDTGTVQSDHLQAMQLLIEHSTHFIYIENQFFVSNFSDAQVRVGSAGQMNGAQSDWDPSPPPGPGYAGPGEIMHSSVSQYGTRALNSGGDDNIQNNICQCLGDRIKRAIFDPHGEPFHVYITLPVHPEGKLNDGAVATQVHWTMQTLVFGRFSLMNRIRRHLWAKREFDARKGQCKTGKELAALKEALHKESEVTLKYADIEIDECFKFVTLLNLRSWTQLNGRPVTEQVYVHSKLMIVDDRYVLLGSANINDRSLLGDRDSELGVLLIDTQQDHKDVLGDGKPRLTRNLAHKLRVSTWEKIFGVHLTENGNGVKPASALKNAILKPGSPSSWKSIQEVSDNNADLYEKAFLHIPRNFGPFEENNRRDASIWPVFNRITDKAAAQSAVSQMPFDGGFWKGKVVGSNGGSDLEGVKGFAVALPYAWTRGENNDMRLNNTLVTEAKPDRPAENTIPGSQEEVVLAIIESERGGGAA
ncbi:phospholipase D-like domain-containing protein [Cupriavidus numazuensis]|uniref:Cardiolipin synthase n=1 Tax=Cupriavidus numazuensis TaxID=221992 RepID=A0ABM8TUR4_9BURK|nr:phospholipase D-like domain-containing protein [Cupriavidus numazuensis]CAG2160318.1 Cardiolipin synthase [Cupriavidus numazuensis]